MSSSGVQISELVIINRMLNYPICESWKKNKLDMTRLIAFNIKYIISAVNKDIRMQIKNARNKSTPNLRQNKLFYIEWVTNNFITKLCLIYVIF
jgi:hypothetical protein